MGRMPLSDAEKKARGTFKPGESENSRATAAVSNVLAFPVFSQIPPCSLPFREHSKGLRVYTEWCQDLVDAGLLTKVSLKWVEQLAIAEEKIDACIRLSKNVPDRAMEHRATALRHLERLNVDKSLVEGQAKTGAFRKNGFPSRLRLPAAHRARRTG